MQSDVLLQGNFPKLKLVKQGKVREIYDLGEYFLFVVTDRLSAFDVIMGQGIPYKGEVLNRISEFWFNFTKDIIPNHLVSTDIKDFPKECQEYASQLAGRSMLVRKAEVIPIECIVRGYITGSGWNDYLRTGRVSGIELPKGLQESEKLPEPIFTPSTKAEIGEHDENITNEKAREIAGEEVYNKIKNATIAIYKAASEFALSKGIIIADTKMEFGVYNGEVILVDELLTPDSSRFWPLDKYQKGKTQESYDKQFVRDYLVSTGFNKQPPPPPLPENVIRVTSQKYLEALYKLTGNKIAD
ncbi:MAG: phosphoribosylaminoimidazolesuccinocarboxamide synthase [Ignavibacteria bacterium]|jgi:phosphoribosylaminoimidazole-succinocarboxamide synthase|nr:phosphoribosylaminoimidazolesuccinocarboxamide synthase [Ignavibacteria bacterium]MCU7505094.1 phosphoribosylaminoimidazolesuccinocarboxamide synthase [Ignavibacteria bacterium]MCU7518074.1 phosphoribosylaminoimidazolesuccinocarboxamide synthase [Ignavibacteria bacterium]